MGMLLGDTEDTPHFDMRRFILEPGQDVPAHTNTVEHEQYVLEGSYEVGLDDETFTVHPGDALLIPVGVEHWYRNDSDEHGSFLCLVPQDHDEIELID
jgi:quercetin dioxygenase-like cupin family protein